MERDFGDEPRPASLRAIQVFGRHMIEQSYGRIINIGSLSCFLGLYEVAAYGASKAGVLSLTKSVAVEWARHGVCVNALVPGVFRTALNAALLDGTASRAGVLKATAYANGALRSTRSGTRGGCGISCF